VEETLEPILVVQQDLTVILVHHCQAIIIVIAPAHTAHQVAQIEAFQDQHQAVQAVHLLVPIQVLEEVEVRDNINEILYKFNSGFDTILC
jgi:GTP:adenosylcobinamide-phosphate guanylyltransferase